MTYQDLVEKAAEVYCSADASSIQGHLAVQFNVTGEGEGAFYLEVENGKVDIQPFEYYDRDAIVYIPGDVLYDILDGKLTMEQAYNDLMLGIEGELGAAILLKDIAVKHSKLKKLNSFQTT